MLIVDDKNTPPTCANTDPLATHLINKTLIATLDYYFIAQQYL